MKDVDLLMRKAVTGNVFPGGVLLVSKEDKVVFFEAYGYANIFSRRGMNRDTIFDLASLTKPLATTLAVMRLIQQNRMGLDQDLASALPRFKGTAKGRITIRHLLSHTSGLPDYQPYYKSLSRLSPAVRKHALRNLLVEEPPLHSPNDKVVYSDLGFMILEWVVEWVSGKRLDHFVADEFYTPLGITNLFFVDRSAKAGREGFAATELCPWRHRVLEGKVHDDNAYVMGGIGGHAGLFGTANDVLILLLEMLFAFHEHSSKGIFEKKLLKTFFTRHTKTECALGFDTPSASGSSSGKFFSKRSVGHLGFTGTSFWMDLDRSVIVILLTNRVHPTRSNDRIKAFRPILHDTVMKRMGMTGRQGET